MSSRATVAQLRANFNHLRIELYLVLAVAVREAAGIIYLFDRELIGISLAGTVSSDNSRGGTMLPIIIPGSWPAGCFGQSVAVKLLALMPFEAWLLFLPLPPRHSHPAPRRRHIFAVKRSLDRT